MNTVAEQQVKQLLDVDADSFTDVPCEGREVRHGTSSPKSRAIWSACAVLVCGVAAAIATAIAAFTLTPLSRGGHNPDPAPTLHAVAIKSEHKSKADSQCGDCVWSQTKGACDPVSDDGSICWNVCCERSRVLMHTGKSREAGKLHTVGKTKKAQKDEAKEDKRPDLALPEMFGSHMVLPHGREVRLFGWARPGTGAVTVRYAGSEFYGHPDESWFWEVRLPPMPVSMEPTTIKVSTDTATITLTDVLVGELYMCIGASNVEFRLDWSTDGRPAVERSAGFGDRLRITMVKKQEKPEPQMGFEPKFSWQQVQDDNNTAEFSALCYFFGLEQLSRRPQTPVGLVQASWGATSAWQWCPRQALKDCVAPVNESAGYGPFWEPISSSVLWYGMVHPWSYLNVKGLVLNLQGDVCILPFMVKHWREAWVEHGNEEPAVIAAQFGCNTGQNGAPHEITDARIDQMHYLETDRTVLAVTSDFCDTGSPFAVMHSPFKREEASRLAQVAEVVTQGNASVPQAFPVVTATYVDEWDHCWGASCAGSVLCESTRFGIRVEFDQDIHVRPEFQALLDKYPHANGFTLYAAVNTQNWTMPVKVSLTAIHGNVVQLNTTVSASDTGITEFFPATLVYGDGAFPILPLTNWASEPVGVFKADVPMDKPTSVFSLYKRAEWAPGLHASAQNAGWFPNRL